MLWLILSLAARADSFTLDNGTTLAGTLAEYNLNGSCQVSITEGPLVGALVVLPCERIARFERSASTATAAAVPLPIASVPVLEEEVLAPPAAVMPLALPLEEAPFAAAPVDEDEIAEAAASASPEEPLWADETGAEAAGAVASPSTPTGASAERSIGGVVLPSLPNLRVMRRPSPPPSEEEDTEAPETL